jgi:4-carboxymuconolactone decarboxylase
MTERFTPVDDAPDDVRAYIEASRPAGRGAPGPNRARAPPPEILRTFLAWARVLAREGALTRRDHEILALRASLNCRSPFEWGEHLEFARAAGLGDEELAGVVAGPDAPVWHPYEAALVRAADELHAGCDVDDATWAVLAAHLTEPQLVEVVYVVGQYTMLSMVANGLRVQVPEGFVSLP